MLEPTIAGRNDRNLNCHLTVDSTSKRRELPDALLQLPPKSYGVAVNEDHTIFLEYT